MINRVVLIGRLTRNPEIRMTMNNKKIVQFSLAVQRNKDEADFITCIAWEKTAELIAQYTQKGTQIGVEGRLQTNNYEDPNYPGRKVYETKVLVNEISFLDNKETQTQPLVEPVLTPVNNPTIQDDNLPF